MKRAVSDSRPPPHSGPSSSASSSSSSTASSSPSPSSLTSRAPSGVGVDSARLRALEHENASLRAQVASLTSELDALRRRAGRSPSPRADQSTQTDGAAAAPLPSPSSTVAQQQQQQSPGQGRRLAQQVGAARAGARASVTMQQQQRMATPGQPNVAVAIVPPAAFRRSLPEFRCELPAASTLEDVAGALWARAPVELGGLDHCGALCDALAEAEFAGAMALCRTVPKSVARVVCALEHTGRGLCLLQRIVDADMDRGSSPSDLFRGSSMTYWALGAYAQIRARSYLRAALAPALREISRDAGDYETDPAALRPGANVDENRVRVLSATLAVVESVVAALPSVPEEVRAVASYVYTRARRRYGDGVTAPTVGGLVFVRFVCPAVVEPERYGLVAEGAAVSRAAQAGLREVAKILQTIALNNTFDRYPHMKPMASSLDTLRRKLRNVFGAFVFPPPGGMTPIAVDEDEGGQREFEENMLWIHGTIRTYFGQFRKTLARLPPPSSPAVDLVAAFRLWASECTQPASFDEPAPTPSSDIVPPAGEPAGEGAVAADDALTGESPEQQQNAVVGRIGALVTSSLHPRFDYQLKVYGTDHYPAQDVAFSQRPLSSWPVVGFCRRAGQTPTFELVPVDVYAEERSIESQVSAILGCEYGWAFTDEETHLFAQAVYAATPRSQRPWPSGAPQVTDAPYPGAPTWLSVSVAAADAAKTVECRAETTVRELVEKAAAIAKCRAEDVALKVVGYDQYVFHDDATQLARLHYVRECVKRCAKPSFVVCTASDVVRETPLVENFELEPPGAAEASGSSQSVNIAKPLSVTVHTALNIASPADCTVAVEATIYHGGVPVSQCCATPRVELGKTTSWNCVLNMGTLIRNIPKEARVVFAIVSYPRAAGTASAGAASTDAAQRKTELAWTSCRVFDHRLRMISGTHALPLLPGHANPIGICVYNMNVKESAHLRVVFPAVSAVFPSRLPPGSAFPHEQPRSAQETAVITRVLQSDPLYSMSDEEKQTLWKHRSFLRKMPTSIPKLMLAVPWTEPSAVAEVHTALDEWPLIDPVAALELLDGKYPDARVRAYAVRCLKAMRVEVVGDFLMQLVQALKCESYHHSALALFLLGSALNHRQTIGNSLFWMLRCELHAPEVRERFLLVLRCYLRGSGAHRDLLLRQYQLLDALAEINKNKSTAASALDRLSCERLALPHDPSVVVMRTVPGKCRVLDSARAPLWLSFVNADTTAKDPVNVLFKVDDDLRQDMLALQVLRIMNNKWLDGNLDMELTLYKCVALGPGMGMVEIVPDCVTVGDVQKTIGGSGITSAFKDKALAEWLRKKHSDKASYESAVNSFMRSLAGYCVGTYLIGVGDRHNDNILLTKRGRVFHIDFGHILGNVEKWKGIRRERAPFVLTPEYVYVLGGREGAKFAEFVQLCCSAYAVTREHSSMFINLFAMMLSTGIPELSSEDDVMYLRGAFCAGRTAEDARATFEKLIYQSLGTVMTRINNAIHIAAHPHINEAHEQGSS
eukprot:m51a1_g8771 putative phosphatidylinositol- -diphosphate 3-kinase (1513) ;mRNA; r:160021-166529